MAMVSRLALVAVCAVLAVTAGWAVGRITAALVPTLPVPGYDLSHLHDPTY